MLNERRSQAVYGWFVLIPIASLWAILPILLFGGISVAIVVAIIVAIGCGLDRLTSRHLYRPAKRVLPAYRGPRNRTEAKRHIRSRVFSTLIGAAACTLICVAVAGLNPKQVHSTEQEPALKLKLESLDWGR
jgi:hypothetical protein